jgi:uncharacterized membrane protein YhaH (DUF805 family)
MNAQFYFSPAGRVNRKQWWLWLILPAVVVSILLAVLDRKMGTMNPATHVGTLGMIWSLIILIPALIVDIKRFHDRDKSGWWVLIALVPIVGAIWLLIELGFLGGTPGPNRFGPPPAD